MPINAEHNPLADRSVVLVGLMGSGKTAIGKRLAARLGMAFFDADHEIEQAAGISVAEIFARHGEAYFRAGEKRVINRLLNQRPIVLSPGGGAFLDPETRALIRNRAISIWLHCPLRVLLSRVRGRTHRPLLAEGDPAEVLARLATERNPFYAQADIVIHGSEDPPEMTTQTVLNALSSYVPARRVNVQTTRTRYEVCIGTGLIARAGALMLPILPEKRCVIVTDSNVAALHLPALQQSLEDVGIAHEAIVVAPGEAAKSVDGWAGVVAEFLTRHVDRHTTILALGGGVVGDLAGFAAAATLRGLPFVQIPTSLLAQVDSSVGGKTGINAPHGKNLIGAFHQPRLVLADIGALATLPARERRAGYAEIAKAGLIGDAAFFGWCETNVADILSGASAILAEAVERAVDFKAAVVGDDEREEKPNGGRALLNFGHTFGHALEAETGYGDRLLHGEAVAVGIILATDLSVRLGLCEISDLARVRQHFARAGLPVAIERLPVDRLLAHMKQDKKSRAGRLTFILTRGIGQAFTCPDVPEALVREVLLAGGAVQSRMT